VNSLVNLFPICSRYLVHLVYSFVNVNDSIWFMITLCIYTDSVFDNIWNLKKPKQSGKKKTLLKSWERWHLNFSITRDVFYKRIPTKGKMCLGTCWNSSKPNFVKIWSTCILPDWIPKMKRNKNGENTWFFCNARIKKWTWNN
jgi:hypothetical protein